MPLERTIKLLESVLRTDKKKTWNMAELEEITLLNRKTIVHVLDTLEDRGLVSSVWYRQKVIRWVGD